MNLLDFLLKETARWQSVFPQGRTLRRAVALGFGILCGLGRRTLTRAISFQGNTQKDWSADYKVFSRSPWQARELFSPILEHAIGQHQLRRLVFSADDTRVWCNGKHVPQTQWHRDPMGPPFQTNLRWGHRFSASQPGFAALPAGCGEFFALLPVRFELAPVVKKPGKKATEAAWAEYRKEKKEKNLSVQFVIMTRQLRQHLNRAATLPRP
jgi:hypothetical protein